VVYLSNRDSIPRSRSRSFCQPGSKIYVFIRHLRACARRYRQLCTYYCRDGYALVARYGDEPLKGRAAFRDAGGAVRAARTAGIQAGTRSSPGRGAMNVVARQIQEVFQSMRLIAGQILIGIRDKWGKDTARRSSAPDA